LTTAVPVLRDKQMPLSERRGKLRDPLQEYSARCQNKKASKIRTFVDAIRR
jgi:hypothetical protein